MNVIIITFFWLLIIALLEDNEDDVDDIGQLIVAVWLFEANPDWRSVRLSGTDGERRIVDNNEPKSDEDDEWWIVLPRFSNNNNASSFADNESIMQDGWAVVVGGILADSMDSLNL